MPDLTLETRKEILAERFNEEGLELSVCGYNTGMSSESWGYSIWYWEDLELLLWEKERFKSLREVCDYLEKNFDELVKEARSFYD